MILSLQVSRGFAVTRPRQRASTGFGELPNAALRDGVGFWHPMGEGFRRFTLLAQDFQN